MRQAMMLIVLLVAVTACSRQQAQRAAYETLHNIKQQRCDDRVAGDCQDKEGYDSYQRQRREILSEGQEVENER